MEGRRHTKLAAIAATLVLVAVVANAEDCGVKQLQGLAVCLPAVRTDKPEPQPSPDCCKAVSGADLNCVCTFQNSPLLKSFKINKNLAMGLPAACKLDPSFHC